MDDNLGRRPTGPLGLWLVGAHGDIATTTIVGAAAITAGLAGSEGLTTARPPLDRLPLVGFGDLVFGGIDIDATSLPDCARAVAARSRTLAPALLDALTTRLAAIEQDIVHAPELAWDPAAPPAGAPALAHLVEALRGHLRAFRQRHGLARMVVVNLMTSLPHPAPSPAHGSVAGVEGLIATDRKDLFPPAVCYAWAALAEGCAYVNFTPNAGTDWGGIAELAARHRVPFYGDDGKTGETLVKTALAPLFAARNLRVLSWEGVNLLGNADGRALADPRNRAAKLRNKGEVLADILGYAPHAGVTINYVPSLGDWKTAWDLIHFQGFLGVPMTMQFTWQGCDSILAAPLVLDLARLAGLALDRGEVGPMPHLACFFKHPLGVTEMAFGEQFRRLLDYAAICLGEPGAARGS